MYFSESNLELRVNISASPRIVVSVGLILVAGATLADEPVHSVTPKSAPITTPYDGFVSIAASGLRIGFLETGFDYSGTSVEGAASVAMPLSGPYVLQADMNVSSLETSIEAVEFTRTFLQGTVHIFWRDPAIGSFGVITQYSDENVDENSTVDIPVKFIFAGIEGQYFLNTSTLYLQLAYERINEEIFGQYEVNGGVLGSEFRTFFQPNLMTTLRAGYEFNQLSFTGFELDATIVSVGAVIEYAPDQYPVSFFGTIDGLQQSYDIGWVSGEFEESVRALVGIKYNFGSKSLFERDRNGASMTPLRPYRPLFGIIIPAG